MTDTEELACVVIYCSASRSHYAWLAESWYEDPDAHERAGRKLIANASHRTCDALRDLLNQQLEEAKL